jgi:hypothetical protein
MDGSTQATQAFNLLELTEFDFHLIFKSLARQDYDLPVLVVV